MEKSKYKKRLTVIIIGIVIIGIAFYLMAKGEVDKDALTQLSLLEHHIDDIKEYETYSIMEVDGVRYYNKDGARNAKSRIAERLVNFDICVELIDDYYSKSAKNAVDKEVANITNYAYRTWDNYRKCLVSNYYVDSDMSKEERAEKIVERYTDGKVDWLLLRSKGGRAWRIRK